MEKIKKPLRAMEEAKNYVSEDMRKKLALMWERAHKTEYQPIDTKLVAIGRVSDNLNKEASRVLRKEIKAQKQHIRLKDVRHIDEQHGVGNEKTPTQIPVTKDIFMLIPDVLENFDEVKKGSETVGRDSIRITKNYSDGKIIIADAVLEDGNLTITSMYVKSPTTVRQSPYVSGSRLSNTQPRQPTLHENKARFTGNVAQQDNINI
jgi:hypothetical protein